LAPFPQPVLNRIAIEICENRPLAAYSHDFPDILQTLSMLADVMNGKYDLHTLSRNEQQYVRDHYDADRNVLLYETSLRACLEEAGDAIPQRA